MHHFSGFGDVITLPLFSESTSMCLHKWPNDVFLWIPLDLSRSTHVGLFIR